MQAVLSNAIELIIISFAVLVVHQFIGGLVVSSQPQMSNHQLPVYASLNWVNSVVEENLPEVDMIAIAKLPQMKVAELRKLGSANQIKGAARMNKAPLISALQVKMVST